MKPILLIGGSGVVGSAFARLLRQTYPGLPLIISGRDAARAAALADELGGASAVSVDLTQPDLGLGELELGAIAILFKDERVSALRYAQRRGVPFLSISTTLCEVAPEIATFTQQAKATLVLGGCWLVGLTAVGARLAAASLANVDAIHIGAVLDGDDFGGPAAALDSARMEAFSGAALQRRDGAYVWASGDDLVRSVTASDGAVLEAFGYSSSDVPILAETTDAPNITFDLAVRDGSDAAKARSHSEILYQITGTDETGQRTEVRYGLSHPQGQVQLTALGGVMVLERLAGLSGSQPDKGLHFADALIDESVFGERVKSVGGTFGPI